MEVSTAILERLEKIVESLQDNSIKMGQLLAVHQEKLDQQEKIDQVLFLKIDNLHSDLHTKTDEIKQGCERDILLVDERIRQLEKKLWSIAGGLAVITVLLSNVGSTVVKNLTSSDARATIGPMTRTMNELPRQ